MEVLKNSKDQIKKKHVGVYLLPHSHRYMTLYSLAFQTTKNKILSKLVDEWIEKSKKEFPDSELIPKIVNRINVNWKIKKQNGTLLSFIDYKKVVESELMESGINPSYINIILSEIKD